MHIHTLTIYCSTIVCVLSCLCFFLWFVFTFIYNVLCTLQLKIAINFIIIL